MKIVERRVEMDVSQNQVTLRMIPENNAMNQNSNPFFDLILEAEGFLFLMFFKEPNFEAQVINLLVRLVQVFLHRFLWVLF